MRPNITCFMMSSIDGRTDCAMTEQLEGEKEYYDILESYNFDAYLSGKNTAYLHYAKKKKFVSFNKSIVNKEQVYKGLPGKRYNIVVDTYGTLMWRDNLVDGLPLIIILSESTTIEYLTYLKNLNISYIVVGKEKINLSRAMEILTSDFNVTKLGVVGGGTINGSFLEERLLDEISILIGPGIDGRKGMTCLFDGLPMDKTPYRLVLLEVNSYDNGCVWLRYKLEEN